MGTPTHSDEPIAGRYQRATLEAGVGVFETWRAYDLHAGRRSVRLELFPRRGNAEAFEALVKNLKALSDVALPRVLDGGHDDRRAWVVSEYFEGRALSHWLAGHRGAGTLPSLGTAQRIFEKVGQGASYLHEARGVSQRTHGGLCARNVLLKRAGAQHTVKLLGAGLITQAGDDAGDATWERAWPYLAPERLSTSAAATASSDLFALGVVLVELLTTHATPEGQSLTWGALVQSQKGRAIERMIALRDEVPKEVWSVVARALAASPKERPASVSAMLRELRDAWIAAGRWEAPPSQEREPPDPAVEKPDERAAGSWPSRPGSEGSAPVGWKHAERAPAVDRGGLRSEPAARVPAPSPRPPPWSRRWRPRPHPRRPSS